MPLVNALGSFAEKHPAVVQAAADIGLKIGAIGVAAKGLELITGLGKYSVIIIALGTAIATAYEKVKAAGRQSGWRPTRKRSGGPGAGGQGVGIYSRSDRLSLL